MRWLRRLLTREDQVIDGLLAQNVATFRPGMEEVDDTVIAKIAAARWEEALAAQMRQHQACGPSPQDRDRDPSSHGRVTREGHVVSGRDAAAESVARTE